MAFYSLEPQEIVLILQFVNDENDNVLKTAETVQKFISISASFMSRLHRGYQGAVRRANSAERTTDRLRTRLEGRTAEGQFVELDLDSLDIALCIVFLLREKDAFYSRAKVQYLLYEAYARWLAEHQERLTKEHPVAQEWGPHFWHISKKCGHIPPVTTVDDFRKVAEQNAGVAAFLRNLVNKYADWSDEELKRAATDGVPYRNAMAKKNDTDPALQKWGREIKDADIYSWKK